MPAPRLISVALWLALTTIGFAVSPALASAEDFPYCPPKENADCFLLNQVNQKIAPVPPGQEAALIAAAYTACEFMRTDRSGSNPILDYAVWLAGQPDNNTLAGVNPTQFALFSARAYCPAALP